LIGLGLELPLSRLESAQLQGKRRAICRRMNKRRFIQRAMKRCSREKWLVKAQQDKADAIATSPTALSSAQVGRKFEKWKHCRTWSRAVKSKLAHGRI